MWLLIQKQLQSLRLLRMDVVADTDAVVETEAVADVVADTEAVAEDDDVADEVADADALAETDAEADVVADKEAVDELDLLGTRENKEQTESLRSRCPQRESAKH
jgi:hypothetical protein